MERGWLAEGLILIAKILLLIMVKKAFFFLLIFWWGKNSSIFIRINIEVVHYRLHLDSFDRFCDVNTHTTAEPCIHHKFYIICNTFFVYY